MLSKFELSPPQVRLGDPITQLTVERVRSSIALDEKWIVLKELETHAPSTVLVGCGQRLQVLQRCFIRSVSVHTHNNLNSVSIGEKDIQERVIAVTPLPDANAESICKL